MDTEDRQQHKLLQKEFGVFYRAVSDILFRHNLMDLDGKHNTGEYDTEVDLFLLRVKDVDNQDAVQDVLYQVFRNAFGEENCGRRERYDGAAAEIWKAYQRHLKK
ncbi:hypothetical protein SBA3_3180020 [Candidatus Sulfopaludibacter sp. SbA3]|nr:hypothetical protein SBA3_3180020 [Candidatus Sulfopaludibacter sp. SbA3]